MADWRGYFYVEDLNLTVGQRQTLVEQLKLIGERNNSPQPNERNHWRVRLDGKAVIFEAVFNDAHLSALSVRDRLATIFGVAPASITYATTQTVYGPLVTYTYNSTARLRLGVFGGLGASWAESHLAALAYLLDNAAVWE